MSITSRCPVEHQSTRTVPIDPFKFGKDIQYSQPNNLPNRHYILFNKGRYFETTVTNPQLREAVIELTDMKPEYTNMFVGSWREMEDFVIAMNILGYYVEIEIDWI